MLRLAFFSICALCCSLFAQTNIIANGDFSNGLTSWVPLGIYADAGASGSVLSGSYTVTIQKPGSEVWNIQFTQVNIKLDSAALYCFSFDASSSTSRTIEANIEMNSGAYNSYSGNGTLSLTPDQQHFSRYFLMNFQSDSNARVGFNLGKFPGNVTLDNISLQKITAPTIKMLSPLGGEQVSKGSPLEITWMSVGDLGKLKLDYTADNGSSWQTIADTLINSGSYTWMVSGAFSPWCRFRLSSISQPAASDITPAPFEIIPSMELVRNGHFTDSSANWNLGVYGGRASGTVVSGKYVLAVDTPATMSWQIQLSQTGIALEKGQTYVLSFAASASNACSVNVNVGMSSGAFTSYFDSAKANIAVGTAAQNYTLEFPMLLASDTNARLEFNCGLSKATIYLDKVSLSIKTNSAIGKGRAASLFAPKALQPLKVFGVRRNLKNASTKTTGKIILVNVLGRQTFEALMQNGSIANSASGARLSPGVYIAIPLQRQRRQ